MYTTEEVNRYFEKIEEALNRIENMVKELVEADKALDDVKLQTREEFIEEIERNNRLIDEYKRAPKYKCPKCGGGMCYNPDNFLGNVTLDCYPQIHQTAYKCDTCGFEDVISSR